MPIADGDVSESEVLSMFDKDGDLRDEPQDVEESVEEGQDQEPEQEEETEAEEEPKAEEEEESEESEEDDEEEAEEPELDWSKVPPEHKAAHEADQKEISKLRKDYGKIQSKLHELSQSRREEDQSTQQLRARAEVASQWEEILEQNPGLKDQIVDLIQKAQNPDSEIPEHLREDPAVQFMLQQNRRMEQQLKQLSEQTAKPLNEWKQEKQTAMNRQKLDGLLDDAGKEYKSMFGKDMDDNAKRAVLKYMVEKKFYEDGGIAALKVFGPEYKKALSAKETSRLREKAAKFGGRTQSVNSRRATSAPKINSETDAISQALRDQGMEF